jgi:hypothetical protein
MITRDDLLDIFIDHAQTCVIQPKGGEAREVIADGNGGGVIVNQQDAGKASSLLAPWIDSATLPRSSEWGYGLIWAADAPEGMNTEANMTVTDSTGKVWSVEAARPVYDLDEDTRVKVLIAWRLVLRGKQRLVRDGWR